MYGKQVMRSLPSPFGLKNGPSATITEDSLPLTIRTGQGDVLPLKKDLMPEILRALQGLV